MVKIGQKVPDFQLDAFVNNEIKKVSLKDYRGQWVILLFYPADFTFVCPTELEEAVDFYSEFKKINAEILSISTDTAFAHKAWHDHSPAIQKVQYPMLADPTGQVSRLFGTYIEEEGLSQRATFMIDPDGILRSLEMHDNSIGRNIKETLRKLRASQFVSEHKGLVCPASWQPGEKTIKVKTELVGQI